MSADDQDAASGMEQVRHLLFGAQVKQIEERIKNLEDLFASSLDALKSEVLASLARQERSLLNKIEEESARRSEGENVVESKTERVSEEIKSSVAALSESLSKAQSGLNALIVESVDRLSNALSDRHNDALNAINDLAVSLRKELASKAALAKLFAELADDAASQSDRAIDERAR
ncbi:MAG: hypothetical protein LBO72_05120 [Helicobacteraceae bacterium]|jgi:hypothetical protein|nr:hypothetical protein [Helicobacteraceae bacterium]